MSCRSIKHRVVLGLAGVVVAVAAAPVLAQPRFPGAGQDVMASVMTHRVEIFPGLPIPPGLYDANVEGPTVVNRGDPVLVAGFHQIGTEIVDLNLVGTLVGPASFPVTVRESRTRASIGLVREQTPSGFPGNFPADSFFDVFIEFQLPGVTVFNKDAAYVLAEGIMSLPPTPPTDYPVRGWIDEGSPLIGQFIDLGNPPAGFHDLPLPLYVQDPAGGPDILVGQLLEGTHTIVPEPGALGLLALGGLMLARRRRQTR